LRYLLAAILSFSIAVIISPMVIKWTKKLKFGQNILSYVENHKQKQGTPTMGGIIFIFSSIIASLCFVDKFSSMALVGIAVFFAFGVLGFLDDFIKIKYKRNLGLRAYQKVIGQLSISIIIGLYVYFSGFVGSNIIIPFSDISLKLGAFIIPFVVFIFIATTNSVNLTDGLDGLAGGTTLIYLIGIGVIMALGFGNLDSYALVQQQNMLVLICAVVGGVGGFLIFNSHPASIFMGDTGSLALGSIVALSGCFTGLELYIPILGLMFVLSTVSVIIQVLHFKRTKKRVFLMAPLHHHFEKKGMYETKIVTIYIIITALLSVISVVFNIM